jgi:hypothetical protein
VSLVLAMLVAVAAALPTTLCVLALWVAHARIVDGCSVDSVFLPLVFLFVPLIFFVSITANLVGVAIGHAALLVAYGAADAVTVGAAGALVVAGCAWTQRGGAGFGPTSAPVALLPVILFAVTDMLILAAGLYLLPRTMLF